jgi:pyridoxal phosphate enzyme (YggS family)
LVLYYVFKMSGISENILIVRSRIEKAAAKVGRSADEIKLVAVSKTVEPERINQAILCGIDTIGENRVQEAEKKFGEIVGPVKKHLVGHLQTNKTKKAVELFDFIQSVDSQRIAEEISKRAIEAGKVMEILVEVNTSCEETKFGMEEDLVIPLIETISELEGIKIKGLMTIGLFSDEPEDTRPCFKRLKELFDRIRSAGIRNADMQYLSMGMTGDFEVAIEEGSNMIRVGTGIFGVRTR